MKELKKARAQHVLATTLDGVGWFMAFAMIGFTDPTDFPGIFAVIALCGAGLSAMLVRLIGRSTSTLAQTLDERVKPTGEGAAAATYLLPIVRHLGEGYGFARAARDVTTATDEPDLQKRVQRMSDVRAVVHLLAYSMFAARFAGFEDVSRISAFLLGIGGVFLTAIIGRMLLAPLEREAKRRYELQSLGAVSNDEPMAVPTSKISDES